MISSKASLTFLATPFRSASLWPLFSSRHFLRNPPSSAAWFAIKYAHDSLSIFGSRYLCDAANHEGIIMGALANVRFPGSETADGFDSTVVDDVDNVLWLQKFALEDTAVKYLATTMNEYTQATESVLKAALRALVKHNDSWKNLDRAIRNTVCIDGRIGCDRTPH